MNLQQFVEKYTNVAVDYDGVYGNQCMDLAQEYNRDVLAAVPLAPGGNAIDVWDRYPTATYARIANGPTNHPSPGDIVIWGGPNNIVGTTRYGHIAICLSADPLTFTSLDENWPEGSITHAQQHSYAAVLGWLHPRAADVPVVPATPPPPPPVLLDHGRYRVTVDHFLRLPTDPDDPDLGDAHGQEVKVGEIVTAAPAPKPYPNRTTHFQFVVTAKGNHGYAYVLNLAAA